MIDSLTESWSRPLKIVRVLQALGMEVPMRLRRERLAMMIDALHRSGVEAVLADGSTLDPQESPGIEAKIRLRRVAALPERDVFGYDVIDHMPSGGMSECFKVRTAEGEVRFLKKVPVSGIQADALQREQEIYAKLDRASAQHVLQVYECRRSGDYLALVTEFADGGTLDEYVEDSGDAHEGLEPSAARAVAEAVLAGLRELHSLDIVHRDLKPQNVLRCAEQWKLGDFGISKNLTRLVTQGRTFQRMGTLGYAPREQWGGAEANAAADVYAFGKLLVFLRTGQTDIDYLHEFPTWERLARCCAAVDVDARPSLDAIEAELKRL